MHLGHGPPGPWWSLFHGQGHCILRQYFLTFMEPMNRFKGADSASLCSLAGRCDNPIPTRFLASPPPDYSIIPAKESIQRNQFCQPMKPGGPVRQPSVPSLIDCSKIPAQFCPLSELYIFHGLGHVPPPPPYSWWILQA
jgi:hypothetical protein